MEIKKCSKCGCLPQIQTTEINTFFRLVCPECYKYTDDIMSPTNSIEDESPDEETLQRLIKQWNDKN